MSTRRLCAVYEGLCFPRFAPFSRVACFQLVAVSNWKEVVRLLHRRLARTLSKNARLLAHKDRLEANLLRTELELEETVALVSSLLAGRGAVVHKDESLYGGAAAARANGGQHHHVFLDRRPDVANTSSRTGSSTSCHGVTPTFGVLANGVDSDHDQSSLDGSTSSTGSSTSQHGTDPAAEVPAGGGDLYHHRQGFRDGAPVKTHSLCDTDSTGDTLAGSPAALSPVAEGSEEVLGSGKSETSWTGLRAEDVTSLAAFKALVTDHETSRARLERDRVEHTANARTARSTAHPARSTAAASAPEIERSAPSKSPTMASTAPYDAESSRDDEPAFLRSGSASGCASWESASGSARVATSPIQGGPGIEMSYCLPATAKNPPFCRLGPAYTQSSTTAGRKGISGKGEHRSSLAVVAPGDRCDTEAGGDEATRTEGARAVGTRSRIIGRPPAPTTFAVRYPASSTGADGFDMLGGCPPATRRAARAFAAAAAVASACPAGDRRLRPAHTERSRREGPAAAPTTGTREELDLTRRAIRKDMSDRLSAVTIEHIAAVAAVARSSAPTAARTARSRKRQERPLPGRQGRTRPLPTLRMNAGNSSVRDFPDRFSASHGVSIRVGTQGSAASIVAVAERAGEIRVATSNGVGRVVCRRYENLLDGNVYLRTLLAAWVMRVPALKSVRSIRLLISCRSVFACGYDLSTSYRRTLTAPCASWKNYLADPPH